MGQKGAQVLSKAASTLDEQQKSSADRAKQWLSGLVQRSENQAAIAQESLEVRVAPVASLLLLHALWQFQLLRGNNTVLVTKELIKYFRNGRIFFSNLLEVQSTATIRLCTKHRQMCANGLRPTCQVSLLTFCRLFQKLPLTEILHCIHLVSLTEGGSLAGSADVQRLWRTAAEAARNSIAQVMYLHPGSHVSAAVYM